MPEEMTYYAIVGGDRTIDNPYGLVRRVQQPDGPDDECLLRNFSWEETPVIIEWERGDFADELVEVSQAQADKIIGYFRNRWSCDTGNSA